jgi:hypothetical protein
VKNTLDRVGAKIMPSSTHLEADTLLLQENEQAQKIANTQKAEAATAAVEMTDVSLIFGFKQYLAEVLEGLGHTIMFPLAAGASVIRAILKIREAYLAKQEQKKGAILRAVVETAAALAITTAVVGTFAAAATFALAAPIIFTATLAAKTLFHLGSALYYGIKASVAKDAASKEAYLKNMKTNLVISVVNALTTVAAGLVLIAHKVSFGVLGIIGGALGAAFAAYKAFTIKPAKVAVKSSEDSVLASSEASDEVPPSPKPSPKAVPLKNLTPVLLEAATPSHGVLNASTDAVSTTATVLKQTSQALASVIPPLDLNSSSATVDEQEPVAGPAKAAGQDLLTQVKATLKTEKEKIVEELRALEIILKSHHAFDLRQYDGSKGITFLNTYWWDQLYKEKFQHQSAEVQAEMQRTNKRIHDYNALLRQHDDALKNAELNATRLAAQLPELTDEQIQKKEEEDKAFFEKTGLTREGALEIAHLAGLGVTTSRYHF